MLFGTRFDVVLLSTAAFFWGKKKPKKEDRLRGFLSFFFFWGDLVVVDVGVYVIYVLERPAELPEDAHEIMIGVSLERFGRRA